MDLIPGINRLRKAEERTIGFKGRRDTDVDGRVFVRLRQIRREDDIVAELLVQGGDNERNRLGIEAGILHDDIVNGQYFAVI